ncbi:hypothetical protein ACIBL3_17220 [Kribbella sp. NPDC050124]|uniref:hypothetical protein n=1 Tax=Kribbella sp. NPDC050124 TaxID=3364114 RepID=UPI00379DAB49
MGTDSSSAELSVPPGRTVVAEIASTGAIAYAPRTLRLLLSQSGLAVREFDRLLWLETDRLSAFTGADGQVMVVRHEGETTLVPRDTGTEARALASLGALRAWLDARSQSDSPVPTAPYLGRPSDSLTLHTQDGRSTTITRDRETGIILAARGRSLQGTFELRMTSVEITQSTPEQFAPI